MQHGWKDTISRVHVHVFPGSADTLVRRGGITNDHLIAYSLSNVSAKNYPNRLMCVEVRVCYDTGAESDVYECLVKYCNNTLYTFSDFAAYYDRCRCADHNLVSLLFNSIHSERRHPFLMHRQRSRRRLFLWQPKMEKVQATGRWENYIDPRHTMQTPISVRSHHVRRAWWKRVERNIIIITLFCQKVRI